MAGTIHVVFIVESLGGHIDLVGTIVPTHPMQHVEVGDIPICMGPALGYQTASIAENGIIYFIGRRYPEPVVVVAVNNGSASVWELHDKPDFSCVPMGLTCVGQSHKGQGCKKDNGALH